MLSAMDDAIGRVMAKLKEAGIEEDTLVFFISDNGGPPQANASRNDPLSGAKAGTLEGGIRVPLLVQWKGKLPAGKTYDQPVISLDIHPTAVAAAGGKIPDDAKLDGVNLLPYLRGDQAGPPHEALFWRFGPKWAVRKGDWKLVKNGDGGPKLFDLAADLGEKKDLAAEKPEAVKELQAAYDKWDAQLAKPLWGPRGQ
jgi:arylsulfatase A-like enzyme